MKLLHPTTNVLKLITITLVLSLALGISISLGFIESQPSIKNDEISQILSTNNLSEQTTLYRHLLDRVGPSQAQDMLAHAGLPTNGQTHLLNHTAGLYIYQKYGTASLKLCKTYFLESCYHGFLLQAVSDHGVDYLGQVMRECQKAGPEVSVQCSHSFGHAFLVLSGYNNLTEALQKCSNQSYVIKGLTTYNCYDGVFMENVYGIHEGTPSPNRWVDPNDTSYPCDAPQIDQKYLAACWSNQPALIYQNFSNDIGIISSLCNKLKNNDYQITCMSGLNRQINSLAKNSKDVLSLCNLEPTNFKQGCLTQNASSFFSLGDQKTSFDICSVDTENMSQCSKTLVALIKTSSATKNEKSSWCSKIKDQAIQSSCQEAI
jgi:hypothetical protein